MQNQKVFVANRGEIALRIIEACDRLGVPTVLGVSQADTQSLAARRAGQVCVLGPAHATHSYLRADLVVHAALATGCTAVHPGYGFLSERVDFARLCAENDLVFIGPRPEHLESLGDKLSARQLAEQAGVPVSPGGPTSSPEEALRLAECIGYPVLVKAAFGGGGRGMKQVSNADDLVAAWQMASSEAAASFGDGTVFVERFVRDAKHVEVQVLGDGQGQCIHLGERECSVQFRYQKIIEEAPCSALNDNLRKQLHQYALKIVNQINYLSLGTVEFLFDVDRSQFYFLEINPRVQVEHPVTELVSGVDLVREQLLVAFGQPLGLTQADIVISGYAIEARITAQDPARQLQPSPGHVTRWRPPTAGGVRWDTHMYEGYFFPPYYDALMAKAISYGATRAEALERLRLALARLEVGGVTSNVGLLDWLLQHTDLLQNRVTTRWLEEVYPVFTGEEP